MIRRSLLQSTCALGATWGAGAWAAPALQPAHAYPRALLVNARGQPVRASQLAPGVCYLFHYPYAATPAFLLNLGRPMRGHALGNRWTGTYEWPGGVGAQRSVVAYSAICPHKLVHPRPEQSLISYQAGRTQRGVQDGSIHCCADHCQFDPAAGARVLTGPARFPLAAIVLAHDPSNDTLTAVATAGEALFGAFFEKFSDGLTATEGPRSRQGAGASARVWALSDYSRLIVSC